MTWKPLHTWIATVIGIFTLGGLVWASPYRPVLKFEHDETREIVNAGKCNEAQGYFYIAEAALNKYPPGQAPPPVVKRYLYWKAQVKRWCRR